LDIEGNVASAAVLNVGAVDPSGPGFVTVYPCGSMPVASNLNFAAGQTTSVQAITMVAGGKVCVYSSANTDLVVDLFGQFSPTGTSVFVPVTPGRLIDTREGVAIEAATGRQLDLSMLPASTTAVALNVTVTNPGGAGFVTVHPCGQAVPLASNLNFDADTTIANHATAELGAGRMVCVHASERVDLIIDVVGMFTAPG
jgi:hypothetical protein